MRDLSTYGPGHSIVFKALFWETLRSLELIAGGQRCPTNWSITATVTKKSQVAVRTAKQRIVKLHHCSVKTVTDNSWQTMRGREVVHAFLKHNCPRDGLTCAYRAHITVDHTSERTGYWPNGIFKNSRGFAECKKCWRQSIKRKPGFRARSTLRVHRTSDNRLVRTRTNKKQFRIAIGMVRTYPQYWTTLAAPSALPWKLHRLPRMSFHYQLVYKNAQHSFAHSYGPKLRHMNVCE